MIRRPPRSPSFPSTTLFRSSWLRCVVRWPDTRPPLSRVLPLFGHLGLDLADHRPEGAADTFVFSRVEDPRLDRSEEHTSELQSRQYLVCRLLLEKKKRDKEI